MTSSSSAPSSTSPARAQCDIDPRGARFGAAITVVVLALVLILGPSSGLALGLLIMQTIAFALGGLIGLNVHPYGFIFKTFVRPKLGPPKELEDPRPPQFAQLVGLLFALVGIVGVLSGLSIVFYVAVGFALAAAFLNAAFNFCLGCEMFLLFKRVANN